MSTSFNRRYKREQERILNKINEEFLKRTDGKTPQQVAAISEQIKKKYGLNKPAEEEKE
jgi:hypothetical protein